MSTCSHVSRFHDGTIELGARVRVRGRIVDVDRIEVEYVEAQDGVCEQD